MNQLEERLRAAFEARAQTFEASPDAWQRVNDRKPRPSRSRWALAALPVALLAVFVPVLLNGGLGRNSAAEGADEIYRRLMAERTPAGESVTLDDPAGGELRLWFARGSKGQPELCYIAEPADADPYGACDGMIDAIAIRPGWYEGSTAKAGATTVMDYGVARQGVEAVGAVTKSGQKIAGELLRLEGAPFLLWTVTYAAQDPVSKVTLTTPGRADYETTRSMLTRGADQPTGKPIELAGGLTVGPYKTRNGRTLVWMRQGEDAGGVSLEPQYLLKDAPVHYSSNADRVFGVARKDVAQVRITDARGSVTTMATRPDPWNLGLVLFDGDATGDLAAGHHTTAYDAGGKEIWRRTLRPPEPRKEPDFGKRVGGTIVVPGTEDFTHGPVRLWFVKDRFKTKTSRTSELMLCDSGGVGHDGTKAGGCSRATFDDRNGFSRGTVVNFLPEPGTTIAFGSARPEWESVDAVLRDGRRIPGALASAPGAPARVWYVKYPYGSDIAAHVFKVKGKQLESVWHTWHDCWEAKRSQGRAHALPRGITATLLRNNCAKFWKGNKELPGSFEPIPGGKLSDMIAAERPLEWGQEQTDWYGFTLPGTARVEVKLKGGATATAETAPDPWGQGVMLFWGAVPKKEGKQGIAWKGLRFTGYDAAGQVVWTYEPGWPPD